jgi:hypothetical protein
MNDQRDGFSGFLDGYKAQNLKSVVDSANFQQIQKSTVNLLKKYPDDKVSSLLLDISKMDLSSQAITTMGEKIKALIIKDKAESIGLKNDNEFKILVLNYMDIVKKFPDNNILDVLLKIGELLDD